ncbi:MAG: hypothetical protein QJR14_07300 [Bacillota bacterium]|nr:hypothetical protein [Bacillota bacterium]
MEATAGGVERDGWWAPPGFLPMEPVLVPELAPRPGWVAEAKWDGIRLLAWCSRGRCHFRSRHLRPLAGGWPELAALGELSDRGELLLDGELVALRQGRPSFPAVLRRLGRRGLPAPDQAGELVYAVFDLIYAGGRDLRPLPWELRRGELERRLAGRVWFPEAGEELSPGFAPEARRWPAGLHVLLAPAHRRVEALWRAVERAGWEGVVLKRPDAPYRGGKARGAWEKVKRRRVTEAVVGGYRAAAGELRSLLLGALDEEGALRFVGSVGSGIDRRVSERLLPWLESRRRPEPPFRDPPRCPDCRWTEPELVVRVRFAEWTPELHLRAPVLAGFSTRPPESCRLA